MTEAALSYHWSKGEFVHAFEAGVFRHRVELIEGEIWPVVIGSWHGRTVGRVFAVLSRLIGIPTNATLPSGDSLPDPDVWVQRADATPIGTVGTQLDVWAPADVLLVVEVSNETVIQDLNVKTKIYGAAGYPVYWVVTRDRVFEHTGPTPVGYERVVEYGRGKYIPVGYAGTDVAVDDLI